MTVTPRQQRLRSTRPAGAAGATDEDGALGHCRRADHVHVAASGSDTVPDDGRWYLPRVGESKYLAAPAEGPDLLTVEQVMARLQISRHTIYDLIRTRRLRSVLIGRCRRIPVTALREFLDSLTG